NNRLSDNIPQSLSQLPQLKVLDLEYNKLTADNPQLMQFLENKVAFWNTTQTLPPTDLKASVPAENSIQLHWHPIPYHQGEGYYQIHYATQSGGPYQTVSTTHKLIDNYTLTDLLAHTTYFFIIKTHSFIADKHLISAPSAEFSAATTSPLVLHSQPPINTTLNLGHTLINEAITTTLVLVNPNEHKVTLSQAQITGTHAAEFTLTQAIPPLTLAPQTQLSQSLECRPQAVGVRQATLTLLTDSPQQPTLTYPLTCTGITQPKIAQIKGEIKTQAGAQGEHLYIDAPERITLIGTINPPPPHLGQQADIIVTYEWLPANGDTPLVLPLHVAEQVVLEPTMNFTLLEHDLLLHLAGTFKVNLGYQLAEQPYTADIITLQVRPNRAPVHLRLEGKQIKENSPVGTLIGTLVTVDHDQGDWFTYGIVDPKSQKYFTLVDNQLQVAAPLRLDFETQATHVITLRSSDASGALIEQEFTLEIIDEQAVLEDIALTQYQLPENTPDGFIIGKLLTRTTEPGTFRYQLLDDAGGQFNLVNDLLVVAADAQLDYETQAKHSITLRSQEINTHAFIDKTLTLELVNLIDVALQGAVSNAEGRIIEPPSLNHREKATVTLHIVPDIEHYGQPAELLSVALYDQHDTTIAAYQLDDKQQWRLWDGNLTTLTAIQQVHLEKQHEINLLQGQLAGFSGGELNIYGGYRLLNSGEIVYSLSSFDIEIQ
ncbi:MAG: fibronectin type III domain-containing protein, partial [Pseudomonadota bacterium]|nr:fibronectin type III domain-containing protein [Pseudomonadota bacterium]